MYTNMTGYIPDCMQLTVLPNNRYICANDKPVTAVS